MDEQTQEMVLVNNFNDLSNEELLELYNSIEEHIKYLNNNILVQEDE